MNTVLRRRRGWLELTVALAAVVGSRASLFIARRQTDELLAVLDELARRCPGGRP